MKLPVFDSAEAAAAYLAQQPMEIICHGCAVAPLPRVSAARKRWYTNNHHKHPHREVLIPLRGRNYYGFEGRFFEAYPGRAFFFDGMQEHELLYPEEVHPVQHLWLSMLAEHATAYVYDTRPDQGQPHVKRRVLVRYASMGINPDRLWRSDDGFSVETLSACLRIIAETFLLRWFDYAEEQQQDSDSIQHQQRMVQAVRQHIETTAGRDVSLDRMAELAGYSKYHFLRIFKQHSDCSLQEYIDGCRRQRVQQLLREGCAHKDIAATLGFSGAAAFSRWKRKHLN